MDRNIEKLPFKSALNRLLDFENINPPNYVIGVDSYNKKALCYTLVKKTGSSIEILLCKTLQDEERFKDEVENLSKYFNAVVYEED